MAREVITNQDGSATGVSYVDKQNLQEYTVRAKIVVLAASACESARLLMNSKSSRHTKGLGNSSAVSYTHLDVYKRQRSDWKKRRVKINNNQTVSTLNSTDIIRAEKAEMPKTFIQWWSRK